MKVRLEWGSRNTNKKFHVSGNSLDEACKFLLSRDEWGDFRYELSPPRWTGPSRDAISSVTLRAEFTITMPNWPNYRKQPQDCKDEWNRMWKALRNEHEDGHRKIFEKMVSKLVRDLESLGSATVEQVEAVVRDSVTALDKEQAEYDSKNERGRIQGVFLTISEKCKSRRKEE